MAEFEQDPVRTHARARAHARTHACNLTYARKQARTHASSHSEALPRIAEARRAGDPAKLVGPLATACGTFFVLLTALGSGGCANGGAN